MRTNTEQDRNVDEDRELEKDRRRKRHQTRHPGRNLEEDGDSHRDWLEGHDRAGRHHQAWESDVDADWDDEK